MKDWLLGEIVSASVTVINTFLNSIVLFIVPNLYARPAINSLVPAGGSAEKKPVDLQPH